MKATLTMKSLFRIRRHINYLTIHLRKTVLLIPPRTLLVLICILIGISAGLSAFLLKNVLFYIHQFIHYIVNRSITNILLFGLPTFGIVLTVLYIRFFHKNGLHKGVAPILEAMQQQNAYIPPDHMYGHIFSSALTIGFGGSAGFEAPIVATGSAIGSNIARYFKFTDEDRIILLSSGAAAGIAAVFNAPIAGVLFAIEVLLVGMPVSAFIPLLISSATGAIVSNLLIPQRLFVLITNPWHVKNIPIYILIGLISGFYSAFIIRQVIQISHAFQKIKNHWTRVIIGGILLSVLIFLFPSLYGEGYFSIQAMFNQEKITLINPSLFTYDHIIISFGLMVVLLFLKIYATSITIGAGGNGGIFAPSLYMGALLGYFIATVINTLGGLDLNVVNFTVAGMAGVLAGVLKTPLTALFLIAEITGGYALFIPLMLVIATSYFISSIFEHKSIYAKELEMRT